MVVGIILACAVSAVVVTFTVFKRAHVSEEAQDTAETVDPLLEQINDVLRDPVLMEQARRKIRESRRTHE